MDIPTPEELVHKIEAFIARHRMAETRFGRDAVRDPNLISDLRAGQRLPGLTKLNRIADFMRQKDAAVAGEDAPEHSDGDTLDPSAPSSGKAGEVSAPAVPA
jgi:hypothetical protein